MGLHRVVASLAMRISGESITRILHKVIMKADRECQYCQQTFALIEGKIFANHVRWCDKNTTNGDKGRSKLSQICKEKILLKNGQLKYFQVTCKACQKQFEVFEYENLHPQRKIYFCSRSCSNNRGQRSFLTKEKIKNSFSLRGLSFRKEREKLCLFCKKKHNNELFCSRSCFVNERTRKANLKLSEKALYKKNCQFTFSLNSFPDEFDFSLIQKFGWYKASNRGNIPNGISRDHIMSIAYGFKNHIPCEIISHPANCKLMQHTQNMSKNSKSEISLEDLKKKIFDWDLKYNCFRGINGETHFIIV